jgi:hypothetical protein
VSKPPAKTRIVVPPAAADGPGLRRVGIIAAVGFVVGIAWPKLAGLKLVPSVPEAVAASSAEVSPSGTPAAEAAASAAPLTPPAAATALAEPARPASRLKVGAAQITSCKDASGAKRNECGELAVDALLAPGIAALETCEAGKDAVGMLSIGFELDLTSGKVVDVTKGRSTTLGETASAGLLACLKQQVSSVSLSGVKHDQARYLVFYPVELLSKPVTAADVEPAPQAEAEITPASGVATVSWDAAIVRSAPKDGDIAARILRGTRVTVTGKKNDWYRVKYDAKGTEGWVYKSAIGM